MINDEPWSVIEIAQYCGLLIVAAILGKSWGASLVLLQTYLREMGYNATPKETADFIQKLAISRCAVFMEKELVKSMPIELVGIQNAVCKKLAGRS
ncbi:hypothetical protein O9929_23600 [Vibrio lentus]|nr:hypothetical protein [Vibrio lentus]